MAGAKILKDCIGRYEAGAGVKSQEANNSKLRTVFQRKGNSAMSLITDMLKKVSETQHMRQRTDVPPALKRTVLDSSKKDVIKKKVIILSALILLSVFAGAGAVYVMDFFIKPAVKQAPTGALNTVKTDNPLKVVQNEFSTPATTDAEKNLSQPHTAITKEDTQSTDKTRMQDKGEMTEENGGIKKTDKEKSMGRDQEIQDGKEKKQEAKQMASQSDATIRSKKTKKKAPRINIGEKTASTSMGVNISKESLETKPSVSPVSEPVKEVPNKDLYLYMAKTAENRKNYQEALANYKNVLEIEQKNYVIMNNIADILLQIGSFEESIEYSKKALAIRGDYLPSLINLAIGYIKTGNYDEGKKHLLKALSIDPSDRYAAFNLALLYEKIGDYENAAEQFRKVYIMGDIQGYLGMARIAERQGKTSDAIKLYREIIFINNIDPKIKTLANERIMVLEAIKTMNNEH